MENQDENTVILSRIHEHVPSWNAIQSPSDLEIKRLSGLSNACFRVHIPAGKFEDIKEPRTLLYRRFEQDLTDKRIEQGIFDIKSQNGTGPKLHFQNFVYRIEGFFEGRPLTIWEMRNKTIYRKYANMICDYNFSPEAHELVNKYDKMDPNKLFFHQVLNQWAPSLESKIDAIAKALTDAGQTANLRILMDLKSKFLFDGYKEHFTKLIPEVSELFPIILCHNDVLENNILLHHEDNTRVLLIDYEYSGWNPMAMDLANWVNETMMDNSYPAKNGIGWYTDNIMDHDEIEIMLKTYLTCYYDKYMVANLKSTFESAEDFVSQNLKRFTRDMWNCCQMNNFFWAVWSIELLKPETYAAEGIFNYDFADGRIHMFEKNLEKVKNME